MNTRWQKSNPYRRNVTYRGDVSDSVNDKIEQAFLNVKSFPLKHIIFQSWRPGKTTAGKRVLSCRRNPCSLEPHNARLFRYRLLCCKYYYDVERVPVDDPVTISGAPSSTAFLNHFPEVVLDLTRHRGTPLVDCALECGLTCFMMLPVFDQTSCVGVIEVSMRLPRDLAVIYNDLNLQLMGVGLCINPPKPLLRPLKTIYIGDGLLVRSEIDKALDMVFQSHAISLAHVWMCYETRQHDMILRKIKLKSNGGQLSFVEKFYNDILVLSVKKGEGLVGRALEDHRPHMCTNLHKLSGNKGVLAMLSADTKSKCTSFAICLRSFHVGELDLAFEFFWPQSSNHLALIKNLLSTLRENLPSFTFPSGEQLGDELLVVDSGSVSSPIELSDTTPKALEETKTTVGAKRKAIDLSAGQSESLESEDDDEDIVILAIYKIDYKLFFLPTSASFEDVKEKLIQELELNPVGTYKIMYQVVSEECYCLKDGPWYCLTDGTCLKSCIPSFHTSVHHVNFGVLDVEN